jgi:hypothetical protein
MGWEDEHFYHFDYQGKLITEADDEGKMEHPEDVNAELFLLNEAGFKAGKTFHYLYDFVDEWVHQIEVLRIEDQAQEMPHPVCIDGAGNCPPEDCGGPEKFAHYVAVLKHPSHPDYDEALTIFDPDYQIDDFDVNEVNECFEEVDW